MGSISRHWLLLALGADTQTQTQTHRHTDTQTHTYTHTFGNQVRAWFNKVVIDDENPIIFLWEVAAGM